MATNSELLTKLAQKEFPDLTAPEFEVVRAVAMGEVADLKQWGTPPQKPKKYNPGGGPLRSTLVTWLCTEARAKKLVHRKGLRIQNATFDAELDLDSAELHFLFALHNCRLPGLNAQRATLKSSLQLKLSRVDGEVKLAVANISGQLQFQGARFLNKGGNALNASGATISSSVLLSERFFAVGEVILRGAKVDGQLVCEGGNFLNHNHSAISADQARIGNNVYLSDGFRAIGEVGLSSAKINGLLICQGGRFLNRNGDALNADSMTISCDVFLSKGFRAVGEVRLLGANITGHLDCQMGRFLNHSGMALSADGAAFGSNVLLSDGFQADGAVRLLGVHIAGMLDCTGGSFLNATGRALDLEYAVIHGSIFLDPIHAQGLVNLLETKTVKTLRMIFPGLATASL
ncbi:MAG: hypothetical protein Q7W05_01725, partial [Deltaproteobacteria bacterium]|nr:hypothetical protein [Deltaproteobacteria bacterium]